jgi:heptosyltransferase-2/heptosyltransferase-3
MTSLELDEAIALIAQASLFVGNDSGLMHIAAALGRPVVAVFGSSNPQLWSPWTDSPHRVVRSEDPGRDITRVTTRDVLEAVDGVIEAAVL